MKKVFVDTSAWIALLNEDDVWHEKAHEIRLELIRQNYYLVTSNFIRDLILVKGLTIISLNDELFFAGITLYQSRYDKD